MSEQLIKRGIKRIRRLFSLIFIPVLLFSCVGSPPIQKSKTERIIREVPFYPQEMNQCGPASLASVLNYWRVPISPEDIAREIYSKSAKGTLNIDLIFFAERRGLKAIQYEGGLEDIKRNIELGYPLIVLVDYGFWVYEQNHFMVVLGYNEEGVFVHSGRDRQKFIPLKDFLSSWKRTKFWTLQIRPK